MKDTGDRDREGFYVMRVCAHTCMCMCMWKMERRGHDISWLL